jgi:hypothetical protein
VGEVGQALAFHHRDDLLVEGDAVVADGQRTALGGCLLVGEPVGVALAGVDEDAQLGQAGGAATGDADAGSGLPGGARGLPEDRLATALDAGEDELGAVLAGRSSIRSMATPRRRQERTAACSRISGWSGQRSARWQ